MKTIITFILSFACFTFCFAQTYSTLIMVVLDKDNEAPILGATVIIKEAGWTPKTTGNDGIALFNSSMPVGEIHYIVSKEGYLGQEGTFNITTEEKSNTKKITLTKFQDDRLLIEGEVTDVNGKDLENAIIEAKVADIVKTTKSDQSGNYFIELLLNQTKYDISTALLHESRLIP